LAADINVDGITLGGRTKDVTQIGRGQSSLDDWVEALAAVQDRRVVSEVPKERSRSDAFGFARIGIPVASLASGTEAIGPAGRGGRADASRAPADAGDLAGAVEDAQLLFYLGVKVGSATPRPTWRRSDEFKAGRKARAETGIR
ncbi:MAG TPA: M28 family peptidase, partial [Vicinamibacteria bacterium]|nr:M28 family peptidase [Vicinamibacteria bacterium]